MDTVSEGAGLTPEQYGAWISPQVATDRLQHAEHWTHSTTVDFIFERLKHGLIQAAAQRIVLRGKYVEYAVISTTFWAVVPHDRSYTQLWHTGDISTSIHLPGVMELGSGLGFAISLFGVRFNPAEIDKLRPQPTRKIHVQTDPSHPSEFTAASNVLEAGPPVSKADLRAWYNTYIQIYPDQTEDHALSSAKGMFPDKSVSRQQVRDLFGPRRRGRPTKSAD